MTQTGKPPVVIGIDPSLTKTGISDGTAHEIIASKPGEGSQEADLLRRTDEIVDGIVDFVLDRIDCDSDILIVVEAPALNSKGFANHLYEVGWIMRAFWDRLIEGIDNELLRGEGKIIAIAPAVLKKHMTGKGNAGKTHKAGEKVPCVTCAVRDIHGMTFEKDPGKDKLHAWGLASYGRDVADGKIVHVDSARRGSKRKKKTVKKAA